ncbi:type II toxin-antitoxin system Phd/YefM family antitoxin [Nocardioides hungaricus]
MATVNVYEAKSSLGRLIAAAEAGETTVIARNGKPVAQLGPVAQRAVRVPGRMKGRVRVSGDFDEWTEDDEVAWYGDGSDPLAS